MVPDFSEITTECRGGKMARTSDLICEKLFVVIDHRPTTDLAPFNSISNVTLYKKKCSLYDVLILYCYK